MIHPPHNLENLPLRRAKTVVECTSVGQLTGPGTAGTLLLLKKHRQKVFAWQPLTPQGCAGEGIIPPKIVKCARKLVKFSHVAEELVTVSFVTFFAHHCTPLPEI